MTATKQRRKTAKKDRIDLSFPNGTILLYKNHVKQVKIEGATMELFDILSDALKRGDDYHNFISFMGIETCHLSTWLINFLAHSDQDVLDMFKKVIVLPG